MRKKITVVGGAGNVGASCALYCAQMELGDVVMLDIARGKADGLALDLMQASPVWGSDFTAVGPGEGEDAYAAMAGSDVVVVTAGFPRQPGMSRTDLLGKNAGIVATVAAAIKHKAKDAFVIVVTNPLDVMAYYMWKQTGLPKERVIGMAGVLDSARFRAFIAMELGVSVDDVSAMVLGGHGDAMVPMTRAATVGGIPVTELIPAARLEEIVKRTRNGGAEIVKMMGTSAYYAPAASAAQMVEAILRDKKRVLPAAAYLDGEYGLRGHYFGVPIVLGGAGVEKILEITLTGEEREALERSAKEVQDAIAELPE
jgi:malate dehydrogenase